MATHIEKAELANTPHVGSRSSELASGPSANDSREAWSEQAGGSAGMPPGEEQSEGHADLADTILGDDWWQTAGLQWLDNIEVPEEFMAGAHLHMDEHGHGGL